MGRVEGKVCIITGAASGMGLADAQVLAREGAKVVLTDLNEEQGTAAAETIGDQAIFVKHDVSDEASWQHVLDVCINTFGRLDVLVNNAGIMAMGDIESGSLADFQRLHRVNVDGVFLGCKYAVKHMKETGGGSIINMSSISALYGMSFIAGYSSTKGAVRALTKSVAVHCKERKYNIRCNSIHPDGVKTPMIVKVATGQDSATREEIEAFDSEERPMAEPEEIASLVLYLASDESRFVNGSEMLIDNAQLITPA